MSKPNLFQDKLVQTQIDDAYAYKTHSEYINQMKMPTFSHVCIFCSNRESIPLLNDGSFRCCLRCNKHFKAVINPIIK